MTTPPQTLRTRRRFYATPGIASNAGAAQAWLDSLGVVRLPDLRTPAPATQTLVWEIPEHRAPGVDDLIDLAHHLGQVDAALRVAARLENCRASQSARRQHVDLRPFARARRRELMAAALRTPDSLLDADDVTRLLYCHAAWTLHLGAARDDLGITPAGVLHLGTPPFHVAPAGWSLAEFLTDTMLGHAPLGPNLVDAALTRYTRASGLACTRASLAVHIEAHRLLLGSRTPHAWEQVCPAHHEQQVRAGLRAFAGTPRAVPGPPARVPTAPTMPRHATPAAARRIAARWGRHWPSHDTANR